MATLPTSEDALWAMNNQRLWKQYAGKVVVVWKKRVIASGNNAKEALERVPDTKKRPENQLALVAMPPNGCL